MTKFEIDYTIDDMKAFFETVAKKKLIKSLIFTYSVIGVVIFAIFLIALKFLNISDFMPIIFLGIYIVLVILAVAKAVSKAPEKMFSQFSQSYDGKTIICSFDDEKMSVESQKIEDEDTENNENEVSSVFYSELEKVIETDNYFYIFVNAQTAQIIRKSAVTEGSIEKVKEVLKSVLDNKYEETTKLR